MMVHFVEEDGRILLHILVPLRVFAHFRFKLLDMVPNPELLSEFISFRY
jgi:hypothetical protein